MTRHVFAYGTLMFPEVLAAVTGRLRMGEPATLAGFRRWRVRDRVYPAITEEPGASVQGQLYRDLKPGELGMLDRFESEFYDRCELTVTDGDGQSLSAWAWVLRPGREWMISRDPWSPEAFVSNCLDQWIARVPRPWDRRRSGPLRTLVLSRRRVRRIDKP